MNINNNLIKNNNSSNTIKKNNSLWWDRTASPLKDFRVGSSATKDLNNKIENLKIQSLGLVNSSEVGTSELLRNYITSNKIINLDSKHNVGIEGPHLNEGRSHILKFSNLLKGSEGTEKVVLSSFKEGMNGYELPAFQCKYVPIGNKDMSLNTSAGEGPGIFIRDNNKINLHKIRHYLNLLTAFDFKLSNSNYDYFQFKKSNKYLFAMEKAANFLKLTFLVKGCLISNPIFNIVYTQNNLDNEDKTSKANRLQIKGPKSNTNKAKIIIHLFYYVKTNSPVAGDNVPLNLKAGSASAKYLTTIYNNKFLFLTEYLTKLFNTEVELELVRLYQPYQNSNILVQYLNSESYNKKFIKLVNSLFKQINIFLPLTTPKGGLRDAPEQNNNIKQSSVLSGVNSIANQGNKNNVSYPSGISGVNIKLAGRPINERIIPRLTVKRAQRGNFNRLNSKVIEKSMFTDRSRKGAFNFTVTLSHIFR